ncbi:MAG: TonB-dependent receptor [Desulfobacterales bacterium]
MRFMRTLSPTGPRRSRLPGLRRGLLLPGLLWAAAAVCAAAQTPPSAERFAMEEVVVTASRFEEEIRETPRNVTVITAADIARATSNFVPELLARETGVILRSLFGTDKNAGIDIRGMGETAASNVLVLVDGFRLNPPDLSGPDFSTLPIDEIERIEIVRGANSVLYGSGAVGGVVNIITKRGAAKPSGSLYGAYGSYGTFDARAAGGGSAGDLNLALNASLFDTDGYRENGGLTKKDAGLRARYDLSDRVDRDHMRGLVAHLNAAYHTDRQGLPGGVPIEDIDAKSRRRKSASPQDTAQTDEARLRTGIEADLGRAGIFRLFGGLRDRAGEYVLGYTPLKPKSSQWSTLDETSLTLEAGWVGEWETGPLSHTLQLGAEASGTEYVTERLDQRERKNSDFADGALFALHRTRWRREVSLDLGGRAHLFRGAFRNDRLVNFGGTERWVNGGKFHRRFRDLAGQAGLVWTPGEETSLFLSAATSFRIPNVDEFALAEDDLKPQHGRHLEVGWRERWGRRAETGVTLFGFEIEDEIAFDPNLRLNRNYEETTRRLGAELSARLFATERLTLRGNYTFTRARFLDPGRDVPLVPRHSGNLGLEWRPIAPLTVSLLGTFVGEREDGSSLSSRRFAAIDAYRVVDLKVAYSWRGFKVFAGVNNLFDELYATTAFSETYYPMPTRNFYGGLQWSF